MSSIEELENRIKQLESSISGIERILLAAGLIGGSVLSNDIRNVVAVVNQHKQVIDRIAQIVDQHAQAINRHEQIINQILNEIRTLKGSHW